ncbi:hypothetical protein RI054_12g59760 [Pseudoscourfieldia marina]
MMTPRTMSSGARSILRPKGNARNIVARKQKLRGRAVTTRADADPFGVQTALVIGAGVAVIAPALLNGLKGEPEPCPACGGTGGLQCTMCLGTGRVEGQVKDPEKPGLSVDAFVGVQRSPCECPQCRGAGIIFCKECKGTGYVKLM